ncbi:MAG: twin-arginine translocase subunit TatC [Myxococcota bacterium]
MDETKYTLIEHLTELRSRLIKSMLAIFVTGSISLYFSSDLLDYAIRPLQRVLNAKNRVNTLLVDPDDARAEVLVERLKSDDRVSFRGRVSKLDQLRTEADAARSDKRPLDLVLIATNATDDRGSRATDVLDNITPEPHVSYLVSGKTDPALLELMLDGISLMPSPPTPARLGREIRLAAAAAGKSAREDKLVVLSPLDPFFAYLKVGLVVGLFLACPIWLYQLWRFIAPGLYASEKSVVAPTIVSASLLFLSGGLFAYFVMFPLMFDVMVNQLMPQDLTGSFTVDNYLTILFGMTLAFGVIFETPLIIALLARVGIVTPQFLIKWRRHAIVLAFIIGAVLTPADPISQTLMSVPLVIFYEVGIILAKIMAKKRAQRIAERDAPAESAT